MSYVACQLYVNQAEKKEEGKSSRWPGQAFRLVNKGGPRRPHLTHCEAASPWVPLVFSFSVILAVSVDNVTSGSILALLS